MKKIVYLDIVRIVAIYLVLFAHSYTYGTKLYILNDANNIMNTLYLGLDCFRTINNSLFFMASGALLFNKRLLNDKTDIKKYFCRVLRFCLVLLLFSAIQYFFLLHESNIGKMDLKAFLILIYQSPIYYTYWFMYTYIAFLLMAPFLQKIACDMTRIQFFWLLVLTVTFVDILPIVQYAFGIGTININICINTLNYSAQPILGYYLHENWRYVKQKSKKLIALIISSIMSVCIASGMTYIDMQNNGEYSERFISLFNIITAITVFIICYEIGEKIKNEIVIKGINIVANSVFVIYLLENIIEKYVGHNIYRLIPIRFKLLSCLIIWIPSTMIVGVLITITLKKIPIIKKLI